MPLYYMQNILTLPLQNGATSYNSRNRKWKYACDGWPHCPRDNDEHIFGPHNAILLLINFRTYMELIGSMTYFAIGRCYLGVQFLYALFMCFGP